MRWIRWFRDIGIEDVPSVGGKNASLGEMLQALTATGIRVPDGYAVTADGYRYFLQANQLEEAIRTIMAAWKRDDVQDLVQRSKRIRNLILRGHFPPDLRDEIVEAYRSLSHDAGDDELDVAVRSSATAEDLPTASFAGQQETYSARPRRDRAAGRGAQGARQPVHRPRDQLSRGRGFDHFKVALSVGVQHMVQADPASSGVIFTLDTESGFRDVIYVTSSWGLGENIVQGRVTPDGFFVHKQTLKQGYRPTDHEALRQQGIPAGV